ncbi:hypothetical protein GCM10009579_49700 [Streptomyces javensis]|uniref:Resolvase/invertase-type recombinase catalytic domain-containing protein n=2 Tax=Streptomyces javensis TaxID=114698 RepID=A0ABN1XA47_9ACTN
MCMDSDATKPILAFIYDREVTAEDSAGDRILTCRQFARELGWTVSGQWVDRGSNAVALRRTFWTGMVAAMEHEGRDRRIICLVADWHRIAFDEAARNTLRQTVSEVGGVCVAVSDEQAPGNSRDVAMRRLRASGKQIGPGATLVRHDGATA